jgi:hypothetical protein
LVWFGAPQYVGKFHTSIGVGKKVGLCPTPHLATVRR